MKLTSDQITERMRSFLEAVAADNAYIHSSYLTEGFATRPVRGIFHYPDIISIRDAALCKFNLDDIAAGRPLVTSVILDGPNLIPRKGYFVYLEQALGLTLGSYAEKLEAHLSMFEAAKTFPWAEQ